MSPGSGRRRERHLERVDDDCGAGVGGHRPAHDQPRVGVLDGREVQPALAGAQVGDVRDPQHVRAIGTELPLDQISGGRDARDTGSVQVSSKTGKVHPCAT